MEEEGGTSVDQKIHFACKTLLGRQARDTELQLLKDQYHHEYGILKMDKELRESWLRSGAFPVNRSIEETALATNTLIASTIMNFDEFVIKR